MSDWESSLGELIDYGQAPEFYVDDWCTPVIRHGVLTNAGFRIINGQRVVVIRIVQPALTVPGTQERVARAMREVCDAPMMCIHIADKPKVLS